MIISTVNDLIKELQKVKNKEVPVRAYNQYVDEIGTCLETDNQKILAVVGYTENSPSQKVTQVSIIIEDGRIDWERGLLINGEN